MSFSFTCEGRDRSDTAQEFLLRIIGSMDQDRLPSQHMRNTDLLPMFGVAPFLQLILTRWDAADPRNIILIWQFDRMADQFTAISQSSICSICPINPLEQQDMFCFHAVE